MGGMLRALVRVLSPVFEAIYPRRCVVCGDAGEMHPELPFCEACYDRLELFEDVTLCRRCAMPLDPLSDREAGCNHCYRLPFGFDAACAAGPYSGTLREAILAFKYRDRLVLAGFLADLAAGAAESAIERFRPQVICSIPPARSRLYRRGYDPVALLAERVGRLTGIPYRGDLLVRVRDTRPLASMNRIQRMVELQGAFRSGRPLEGETILLVDDIMTTGTTLSEAAGALKVAGAKRVLAVVVARTLALPPV